MHPWVREAIGILWPRSCAGCGAPDHGVCRACAAMWSRSHCDALDDVPIRWAAAYDGAARQLVLASKEHGRGSATRVLGAALARMVAECADGPLRIVLVPSSRAGWRRRGFAPVRRIARAARLSGVELVAAREATQKGLGREARLRRGRLRVRVAASVVGARCVIVDDVVTTGATVREGVRAVRAGGGRVVAVVALARVPRHG